MKRLTFILPLTAATLVSSACKKNATDDQSSAAASASAPTTAQSSNGFQVPLTIEVSNETLTAAGALAGKVDPKSWRFKLEDGAGRPSAEQLIVLAATDSTPAVAGAALGELMLHKRDAKLDQSRAAVIEHHLQSTDPRLVARAMGASHQLLMGNEPDRQVLRAVMDAANREAFMTSKGRWETLQAIAKVNHVRRSPAVRHYIHQALTDSVPGVVIETLKLLYVEGLTPRNNPEIVQDVLPLLQHDDAGVRGQAALVLGKQSEGDENAAAALIGALADKHAYVRAQAAHALGWLNYKPAIHALVPLANDLADCRYEYTVPTMESDAQRRFLRGAHHLFVAIAVQDALQRLGKPDLVLEQVRPAEPEVSLKAGNTKIKKWYATIKDQIPHASAAPAASGSVAPASATEPSAAGASKAAVADRPAAATKAQ